MENDINKIEPVHFGQGERDYSVDILRIFSCFMVILVHCTAFFMPFKYGIVEEGTTLYYVTFFYRSLFASPTVLFVMVSGIFFLTPGRKVSIKKIWTKNIPKLAFAYIFWCYLYGFVHFKMYTPDVEITLKSLTLEALNQPDPLWYIPMIISVYIFAPILREVAKSSNVEVFRYILVIFIIALGLNTIVSIPHWPYYDSYIRNIISKTPVDYLCQYIMWFMIGYILYSYRLSDKVRRLFYVLGIASVFVAFAANKWQYEQYGETLGDVLQRKFTLTTFFKNTAIFLFFTNNFRSLKLSKRAKKIISKVSGTTLIVYLMHWLILEIMLNNQWLWDSVNPALLIIIYAAITFAIGCVVSILFQMIPWKKMKDSVLGKLTGKNKQINKDTKAAEK